MKSVKQITHLFLLSLFLFSYAANAQELKQTIRGKVIDQDSRSTLPGANIVILDSEPTLGSSTDMNGEFRIENVPLGRVSLKISYMGYEDKVIPNILLSSGKEVVLDIYLQESLYNIDEVEVRATRDKSKVDNEMALISARTFSVEETKRYAGSFNDPARMVSAYAGAATDPEGDNSIIVRGNSPKGIQWRLEGIEIPNPNHFADEGSTGGPINALNSNMLDNSEFYTGAFPAEYGNALSGVFDMNLRKGNNEQREYSLSIGALGVDATMEGPFQKGGGSSYLLNYRYSSLSLLDNLGLVDFGGIPVYQDVSFNVFVPTKSFGTFSLFGLGGKSNIREEVFAEEDENEEQFLERYDYKAHMGIVGVNQFLPLNDNTYLRNSISTSTNGSGFLGYESTLQNELNETEDMQLDKNTVKAATTLHHKFNARHNIQSGLVYTRHFFDFYYNFLNETTNEFQTDLNQKGEADHYQGFMSWKYRPSQTLSFVSGFHLHGTDLNEELSFEPRASLRWQFDVEQAITLGFGVHGKMESLPNYFSVIPVEDGTLSMPNKDIGFTKARHYVLGYENKLTNNLFMKIEAYYQQLYNVPVEAHPNSSYSLINQVGGFTDRVLVNEGTGENVGIELTLERYFDNNYYFLATASLYDSKYKAMDEVERDTRFNGNYVGNLLIGKEFELNTKSENKKVISLNSKISLMGARNYTPIDLEASRAEGTTVRIENKAFSERGDDIFIANIAVAYRVDSKKISQEFKLDIQNASNHAAKIDQYYDSNKDEIVYSRQLSLLPVVMYTIHF